MKICATIDELKKYARVIHSFDPANLDNAELNVEPIVRKFLSDAEYDLLLENYDNDALTEEQEKLMPYVQNAMVSLAMIVWVGGSGQTEVSNSGVHLVLSGDRKTAFQWQITEMKKEYKKQAFSALENLLKFLWKSEEPEYLNWRDSDNRKEYLQYFINDSITFSKSYNIHENFAFFLYLRETMDFVEDKYILPLLGKELFDEIKEQILSNTISDNNDILLKWIRRAVANKTMFHAIPKLAGQADEFGIVENYISQYTSSEPNTPARNEFVSLMLRFTDNDGESYLHKLKQYLNSNSTDYPLYEVPTTTSNNLNNKDSKFFTAI